MKHLHKVPEMTGNPFKKPLLALKVRMEERLDDFGIQKWEKQTQVSYAAISGRRRELKILIAEIDDILTMGKPLEKSPAC